LAIAVTVLKL